MIWLRNKKKNINYALFSKKKVSEYNQDVSQPHNADQPKAALGRATKHL